MQRLTNQIEIVDQSNRCSFLILSFISWTTVRRKICRGNKYRSGLAGEWKTNLITLGLTREWDTKGGFSGDSFAFPSNEIFSNNCIKMNVMITNTFINLKLIYIKILLVKMIERISAKRFQVKVEFMLKVESHILRIFVLEILKKLLKYKCL